MSLLELYNLPFRITPMAPRHVPTVAQIEKETFGAPWSENAFRQEIQDNPFSAYLVLQYIPESAQHSRIHSLFFRKRPTISIIGYGGYWQMVDEAHICTLAIQKKWRSLGLGELVLLSLISCAMDLDIDRLSLEVRVSNHTAQSLYTKYGFEIVGRRRGYYSDNHEDALIMTTGSVRTQSYKQRLSLLQARLIKRLQNQQYDPSLRQDHASTMEEQN